jgi:hypothetical protein
MAAATDTTRFEHAEPILRVSDMGFSIRYYTNVLGSRDPDDLTDCGRLRTERLAT